MPLAPGTILGQYEVRAPLGAGGMGEVYRAHDTRLGRDVAIKVLPESLTSDPQRLQRFEQEARAAAALNHPNILAVYQMSTHEGGISYLVTELLEGETLRERLRRGLVPLRKAIDYSIQIAHGLAAPHEKGIVHRDLKPENLFVTRDERVKILDFGLAKVTPAMASDATLTQGTEPGVVMGTVGYMSPEQVRGKHADHRSDIFAFGTILYELVTGKQTFHKPTSAETMTAILNEDPPPISQVAPTTPPGLQRVVQRCLEKNPEQRFQSASDLAFALESLSDSNITAGSGGHAVLTRRPAHPGIAIAVAVLLLVAGVGGLTYFLTRPPAVPRVSNYVQLTHDGRLKYLAGTDGARIYLYLVGHDYQGMGEMTLSGGEPRRLPILPNVNMQPLALSPNGEQLLVMDGAGVPLQGPLWSVPVVGGSARRLGTVEGNGGAWSFDGTRLAFTNGNELFIANADGSEPRKIITKSDASALDSPSWSPDSSHLRFTSRPRVDATPSIWEVRINGSGLQKVLPLADASTESCCGTWTHNGKYFVYYSQGQLWTLPEVHGVFSSKPKSSQLTSGPLPVSSWAFSRNGKKLFTTTQTGSGELMRFDMKSKTWSPFLDGIAAEYQAFSKDGQWVAYVTYPEGTLWRSKSDGSERLQLTYGPAYAMMPRWSPDGKTIAYYESYDKGPTKMFTVPAEGGTPQPLLPGDPNAQQDPNWSPDGSKIVFGGDSVNSAATIRILDLATHQVSTIPGSQGLFSPRWSPDGRYIPAFSSDLSRLLLYDMQTQKWSLLAKGTLGWLNFTRNGQYLLLLDTTGTGSLVRMRMSDRKMEKIADLTNFVPTGHYNNSLAIAPDDSPLMMRYVGTSDVFAMDYEEP